MKHLTALTCSVALLASACLAGCGSSSSTNKADNTTPATASTNTAVPLSTTTVATTASVPKPQVTVATVATTTKTTTKPTTPPTTTRPTTAVTATTKPAAPTTTSRPTSTEYAKVSSPRIPSTTAAVSGTGSPADGVYYATITEGGTPLSGSVVFELVQLFVGADCTAHFGIADEDACVNDYGVETKPTTSLTVPLSSQYITVADAATQQSLQITGTELFNLIHGDNPAAGAPVGYVYSGFGYLLTVKGGSVTRLEQWWTP